MFDKNLVLSILVQIEDALQLIQSRAGRIRSAEDFTNSAPGMEALDSICMRFMVIGEALRNIDKITGGSFLSNYPEVDWKGVIGFRNIIAHQYFDIDAEQVFWICAHDLKPLSETVQKIIKELN
jgi:uncharacterized protein with HEPN domain